MHTVCEKNPDFLKQLSEVTPVVIIRHKSEKTHI